MPAEFSHRLVNCTTVRACRFASLLCIAVEAKRQHQGCYANRGCICVAASGSEQQTTEKDFCVTPLGFTLICASCPESPMAGYVRHWHRLLVILKAGLFQVLGFIHVIIVRFTHRVQM